MDYFYEMWMLLPLPEPLMQMAMPKMLSLPHI